MCQCTPLRISHIHVLSFSSCFFARISNRIVVSLRQYVSVFATQSTIQQNPYEDTIIMNEDDRLSFGGCYMSRRMLAAGSQAPNLRRGSMEPPKNNNNIGKKKTHRETHELY